MVNIPLEILNLHDDGFHLIVEVVVFGQPFKAVLDTGASKTVLDKTIISQLAGEENILLLSDKLTTGLGTNSMESFTINLPGFKIGSYELPEFEVAVLDLSSINFAYEKMDVERVIGVIGGDVLMQYKALIDYQSATLKLFPSF